MDFCGARRAEAQAFWWRQVTVAMRMIVDYPVVAHVRWLVARSYADQRLPVVLATVEGLVRP